MIKVEKVSKYYNTAGNVALGLRNVSCELYKNEIVAIVGESGSGKSTFLNVITGVDTYEDGELYFNNEPTSHFISEDFERFRKDNVGFIFQNYNLIDSYTVIQNVMLPLIIRGFDNDKAKGEAKIIIEKVGLKNRMYHKSTKLSGGEKQRAVIARSLASDTPILACDEPTGNLDSKTGKEIIDLIKSVSKDKLVLIVTHNYEEIKDIATRQLRFYDGELVEDTILTKTNVQNYEKMKLKEDYTIKRKDSLKISVTNLLSTPKKTILGILIFTAICFFVASLYQFLYLNTTSSNQMIYNNFNNTHESRLIVYNKDSSKINYEEIENKYGKEKVMRYPFIEDSGWSFSCDGEYYRFSTISYLPKAYNLVGRMPINDNEVIVSIPSWYRLNSDILIDGADEYKVVGYFTYYADQKECFIYSTKNTNSKLIEKVLQEMSRFISIKTSTSDVYTSLNINRSLPSDYKLYFVYNKGSKELAEAFLREVKVRMHHNSTHYISSSFIELFESDDLLNFQFYTKTSDTLFNILTEDIKSVSVYTSNPSKTIKELKNMGYEVIHPASIQSADIYTVINYLLFVVQVILFSFLIIILYIFTYFLLNKIYSTKTKDYTMMRTLGINKKIMSKMVKYEVVLICILSMILTFMILLIGNQYSSNAYFEMFNDVKWFPVLIMILVTLYLALLMSKRFNKKLFKFSINTSLKKEALTND